VIRRAIRTGYKSGALEAGRKVSEAEFIAILDSDFVPNPDFLERTMPHFYTQEGLALEDLALVQTQWGHLNHADSLLTQSQSLWVDDHHTLQMSMRARMWNFVNFTGTAGIWRARAIHDAGGWSSRSLVEDCELSFRVLFAGYRTTFVKEIVQPAELPDTYTAYKAQQKRWTQGWAQLTRLHLYHLMFEYQCGFLKKCQLLYHMFVSSQWILWLVWLCLVPWLIVNNIWFPNGVIWTYFGFCFYMLPFPCFAIFMTICATFETTCTYGESGNNFTERLWRLLRIMPNTFINAGMLPHQGLSYLEGLVTLNSEFERTPKRGTIDVAVSSSSTAAEKMEKSSVDATTTTMPPLTPGNKRQEPGVKVHWLVVAEVLFVVYQVFWGSFFIHRYHAHGGIGVEMAGVGAFFSATSVAMIVALYGDHLEGHFCNTFDFSAGRVLVWK